jgi:tRNA (cmo5U34)-methyltransferase
MPFFTPLPTFLSKSRASFHAQQRSVVIVSLILQFLRPLCREPLSASFEGLNNNGCLILIEKVINSDSLLNRLYIKYYYEYKKRNGYSELDVAQKREALENVLIPYRLEENSELLRGMGFRSVETFFRWYNFCGIVAIK